MKAFIRIPRSFFNAALLFAVAAVFLLPDGNLGAREDRPYRIGVFASRNIRPYVEAVDGLRDRLGQRMDVRVDVHFLDQYGDKTLESLAGRVSREPRRPWVRKLLCLYGTLLRKRGFPRSIPWF